MVATNSRRLHASSFAAALGLLTVLGLASDCFLLPGPPELKCVATSVEAAGASNSSRLMQQGNCSFCVILTDNLLPAEDARMSRTFFCAIPLLPTERDLTLEQLDASLGESVQPHQLESFSARRLSKLCLAGCETAGVSTASAAFCRYDTVSTASILSDPGGSLMDTAVISNVTYHCCRDADYCNYPVAPVQRHASPGLGISLSVKPPNNTGRGSALTVHLLWFAALLKQILLMPDL